METERYTIKTTGFEGPFGLLLDLVEKRKLFINDVSLATVTEDYLNYVNKLGSLSPAEISSFVVVASTLILIKSKSLLPNLNLTSEEEGDIRDLEERLRLYELFTNLGSNVKNMFGEKMIFAPLDRKSDILVFLPDNQISAQSMMTFANNVLGSMPKKVSLQQTEVRKVISIEEMIVKLTERINKTLSVNFKDFNKKPSNGSYTREEKIIVIVSFLAMLELVRQGILNAVQGVGGEDIIIEKHEKVVESL